jgi:hypothetical protein
MSVRKKFKIQRSLGLELPGLGKPGALEKRNYCLRAAQLETTQSSLRSPRLSLPSFLQFHNPTAPDGGIVVSIPSSAHVPFEFKTRQVAEYYAKRGV